MDLFIPVQSVISSCGEKIEVGKTYYLDRRIEIWHPSIRDKFCRERLPGNLIKILKIQIEQKQDARLWATSCVRAKYKDLKSNRESWACVERFLKISPVC